MICLLVAGPIVHVIILIEDPSHTRPSVTVMKSYVTGTLFDIAFADSAELQCQIAFIRYPSAICCQDGFEITSGLKCLSFDVANDRQRART
jgi:hypothetical protein